MKFLPLTVTLLTDSVNFLYSDIKISSSSFLDPSNHSYGSHCSRFVSCSLIVDIYQQTHSHTRHTHTHISKLINTTCSDCIMLPVYIITELTTWNGIISWGTPSSVSGHFSCWESSSIANNSLSGVKALKASPYLVTVASVAIIPQVAFGLFNF